MDFQDDMVRGYLAGINAEAQDLPHAQHWQSLAYRHGWLNGRDDRTGKPRERASVLGARAELILSNRRSEEEKA